MLFGGQYDLALERFLSSAPMYRLAVLSVKSLPNEDKVLNIGRELARVIPADRNNEITFQFAIQEALNSVIRQHSFTDPRFGDVVIIENPGILFEPELHVDVPDLLRRVSRSILVILLWPGVVSEDKLCFLRESSNQGIKQSEINYIIL